MENKVEINFGSLSNTDKSKIIGVVFIILAIAVFSIILHYKAVKNAKSIKERNWVIFMIAFTLAGSFIARHISGSIEGMK